MPETGVEREVARLLRVALGLVELHPVAVDEPPGEQRLHNSLPDGATDDDVAEAHQADLSVQGRYGVEYLSYWSDASAGKAFCLVEAPDADTARRVHREAHGLVADEIYPVVQG